MKRPVCIAVLARRLSVYALLVIISAAFPAAYCAAQDAPEMTTVQGIGYPPIRAESAAQAHLMAKRAAVVDAYRNAVAGRTARGQGPDLQYEELSGFVSGMTIVQEEYLKDGGIRITAKIPTGNIRSSAGPEMKRSGSRQGPQAVTLDEWYSIISNLVRYENNHYGGQHEKNH